MERCQRYFFCAGSGRPGSAGGSSVQLDGIHVGEEFLLVVVFGGGAELDHPEALAVLEDFPLTSSDSTTWVIAASYGFIIVDKKTICVSDRRIHDNGNIWHQSIAVQEELDKKVQEFGFTLKELAEDSNKRQLFNIMSMKKWEDTYIRKEKPARKVALF